MKKYDGLEVYDVEDDKPKESIMKKLFKPLKEGMDKKKSDEIFRSEIREQALKEAREELKEKLKQQYKQQIKDEELKKGVKKEGFAQKIAAEFKGGLDTMKTDEKLDRLLGTKSGAGLQIDRMLSKGGNFKEQVGVRDVNTDVIKGKPENMGTEDKLRAAMGKDKTSNEKLKQMLKR